MTVLVVVCGLVGLAVGALAGQAAAGYPHAVLRRRRPPVLDERRTASVPAAGAVAPARPDRWGPCASAPEGRAGGEPVGPTPSAGAPAVRAFAALATAALFALAALRFGASAQLPAWLTFAAAGVLLAVVDLRLRLLPDRIVLPALAIGAVLLTAAAAVDGNWADLARAAAGAAALFACFLILALLAPNGLGMGDVKLAALIGLHLGWLGWAEVVTGAVAGFVVQAALALVLLATRRIGLRGELPFGPALLVGAALAVAASGHWGSTHLAGAGLL